MEKADALVTRLISGVLEFFAIREGLKFRILRKDVNDLQIIPLRNNGYNKASLYVHIPFCKTLCPYCSFNRYRFNEAKLKRYFNNLKKETDIYYERGFNFSNLYIGGGTPTVSLEELIDYIEYLKEKFTIEQISTESTPYELTEESVSLLRQVGINRMSIGVQSFDEGLMKSIGRLYIGKDVEERILLAKDHFDTVNLDFMFNFPTQTLKQVENDLKILKNLDVNQVTFYPLMPSPHKKAVLERNFNKIDTSREKKFYDLIQKTLMADGYNPSTVWCFSKGKTTIDEYIIEYDDYIGLGCGSVSLLRGVFYVNSFSLDRYGQFLNKEKLPIIRWKKLTKHEQMRYYLLTKLFGMQVDTKMFQEKFHGDIHEKLLKEIMFLKLVRLIREKSGLISVTERGMYHVNRMMKEFYGSLNDLREFCIEYQV